MNMKASFTIPTPFEAFIGLTLVLAAVSASADVSYQLTDLSLLPGNDSAHAQSINDSGQIVGFSDSLPNPSHNSDSEANVRNALIWNWQQGSQTVTPQDLGKISQDNVFNNYFDLTSVIKINNHGQVLGNFIDSLTSQHHAILWDKGTLTGNPLDTLRSDQTSGLGINNAGQVVGTNDTNGQAFIWQKNVTPSYPLGAISSGQAINNVGQVIVTKGQDVFLLPNANPISSLSGASFTGLNDRGQVAYILNGNLFIRLSNGSTDNLTGGDEVLALNNAGQAVGQVNQGHTAILWYPTTAGSWSGAINLNDHKIFDSSLFKQFDLNQAFGINNLGQIVGEATVNGQTHGFLATPTGTLNWILTSGTGNWDDPGNWNSHLGFTPNALLPAVIQPNGSALTVNGPSLDTAVNSLALGGGTGTATLNLNAGSLTAINQLTVYSNGTLNFSSANLAASSIINQGTVNISGVGTHTITGDVTNESTFNVTNTSVQYTGDFTNNGAYVSDPSTSQFNNLSVGTNGYLKGGPQDTFIVTGNFFNSSSQNTLWNTSSSNLVFTGNPVQGQTTVPHIMQLAGVDKGVTATGAVNNFSWGSVTLNSGNTLTLTNVNGTPSAALYTSRIILPDGVNSIHSPYNVYYDPTLPENKDLLGSIQHFSSGGGELLPWNLVPFDLPSVDQGLTKNQQNFAAALDEACTSPRGSLITRCLQLQGLSLPQQKAAIVSLTPDQVPGQMANPIKFSGTRMDAPFSRLASLRGGGGNALFSFNFNGVQIPSGKLASALGPNSTGGAAGADNKPFRDNPLGIFVQARFNFGNQQTTNWDRGFNSQSREVTVGADYRLSDQLVAGLAFNYTNTSTDYVQSAGHMNSDTYMGAFYGSYYLPKDFYVDWVANYGGNNYLFNRQYGYVGFNGQTNSNPTGNQYGFAVSSGKDFHWQEWLISPYLRLEHLNMHIGAYQEQGSGGFDMTTGGQTNHSLVSDLGAQISHAVSLPWGVITPSVRVEWEHQYLNDNRSIQMRLSQASPGLGNFIIQTGNPDRDYVNLGGSVSAALPNGGAGFVRYETRLGQSYISDHIVEVGVRMTF